MYKSIQFLRLILFLLTFLACSRREIPMSEESCWWLKRCCRHRLRWGTRSKVKHLHMMPNFSVSCSLNVVSSNLEKWNEIGGQILVDNGYISSHCTFKHSNIMKQTCGKQLWVPQLSKGIVRGPLWCRTQGHKRCRPWGHWVQREDCCSRQPEVETQGATSEVGAWDQS